MMKDATPPELSAEAAERAAHNARLALAFEAVFGQATKRTPQQQLVFDHLRAGGNDDDEANSFDFKSSADGIALIAAGIHRDGAKSILRIVNRQLSKARALKSTTPKTKPTVKR